MTDCLLLQPNLLTIVPGSINIENFIPGRVYKETLTIYNTCKIPIIVNLRASDKSKLLLNKSLLRIEVNDSQKVDLVIQDKINYSSKKLPTTPKKLYIHINGELIEEKYEINLMYFCNNNTFKQKQIINTEKEIPSIYYNQYQSPYSDMRSNRRLRIDKTCNIYIHRYENNMVAALKNKINNLTQQILKMQKSGNNGVQNIGMTDPRNYKNCKNNSFVIISNKLDDPKFQIDNDIDKNAVFAKNRILLVENNILAKKIKLLEEKLAKFENYNKNQINDYNYNISNNITNENNTDNENNINPNYYMRNNNNINNVNENIDPNYYMENNNINNNMPYNLNNNNNMNYNINDNMGNYEDNYENENENENEYNEQSDEKEYNFQDERKDLEINDYDNVENNEY